MPQTRGLYVSERDYYKDQNDVALTTGSQTFLFGFRAVGISLSNDAASSILYSFDGGTVWHVLKSSESFLYKNKGYISIDIKGVSGGEAYRLEAW